MDDTLEMQDRLSEVCLILNSLRDLLIMLENNKTGCITVTVCTAMETVIEKSTSIIDQVSDGLEIKKQKERRMRTGNVINNVALNGNSSSEE